jgi:hypothetical protein
MVGTDKRAEASRIVSTTSGTVLVVLDGLDVVFLGRAADTFGSGGGARSDIVARVGQMVAAQVFVYKYSTHDAGELEESFLRM